MLKKERLREFLYAYREKAYMIKANWVEHKLSVNPGRSYMCLCTLLIFATFCKFSIILASKLKQNGITVWYMS